MPPDTDNIEVALFPIPDVVAFPGMVLPLHVFEPRYRQLIHDCVQDQRLVAVSHTQKTIHQPSRAAQNTAEALNSNQATYKPQGVFSAGPCEILETSNDGRLLATVTMTQRLVLVDEVQSLPYRIVSCRALIDRDTSSWDEDTQALQHSVHRNLLTLIEAENEDLARELKDPEWLSLNPPEYSLRIFQVLRFEADVMQHMLEIESARERLDLIADFLDRR